MTVIKVSLIGGPVGGSTVNVKTNRDGIPPEWHEMVTCPDHGVLSDEGEMDMRTEHHLYRRLGPPAGGSPLWTYRYQPSG